MTKIVAFVPAKSSSERIYDKNLSVLDGEYLFKRKLRQLLACSLIDSVILDTDSDYIASLVSDLPIKYIKRPLELASNATDGHELFNWECQQVEADIYIQALCTAPFVDTDTICRAIKTLINSPENDSLLAVHSTKQYLWQGLNPAYGRNRIPNSTDLPSTTIEAMSLYITRKNDAKIKQRFGNTSILFELSPSEIIDVNCLEDLSLAETIAAGLRAKNNLRMLALTPYLNSALLSDIAREVGLDNCTLSRDIRGNQRFFGTAKTLLLDHRQNEESWKGIYDALDSYQFIRPGDVIMVENRVKNRAYFGNLNAQLAIRAGAIGAVIDGVTRDYDDVNRLGFPVFSKGHYCVDIKYDGTLRSVNMPINIDGIIIRNGDYVFADKDGVVVIPKEKWKDIEKELFTTIEKEFRVGVSVALGTHPKEIYKQLGAF